jgi:hypothetical protein
LERIELGCSSKKTVISAAFRPVENTDVSHQLAAEFFASGQILALFTVRLAFAMRQQV